MNGVLETKSIVANSSFQFQNDLKQFHGITAFSKTAEPGYIWTDIVSSNATSDEYLHFVEGLSRTHNLHRSSFRDCFSPFLHPKFQQFPDYLYFITRYCDPEAKEEADTVQALTNKLAIFVGESFIITIHRRDFSEFKKLRDDWERVKVCSKEHLLHKIINRVLFTYQDAMGLLEEKLDKLEHLIFQNDKQVLQKLYQLKRRSTVYRHMLYSTQDFLVKYAKGKSTDVSIKLEIDPYIQAILDEVGRFCFKAEELYDNTTNLLNLFLSLASHKTNELVSLLTIFSVFFIPLTFIAGIYGMNFDYMPELRYKYSYPILLVIMAFIAVGIGAWLRLRGYVQKLGFEGESVTRTPTRIFPASADTNV